MSSSVTEAGAVTRPDSVARLTVALTPSSLPSFFSTRATQEAQVIPPTATSTTRRSVASRTLAVLAVPVRPDAGGTDRTGSDMAAWAEAVWAEAASDGTVVGSLMSLSSGGRVVTGRTDPCRHSFGTH